MNGLAFIDTMLKEDYISVIVGIDENNSTSWSVYPNPTNDVIFFETQNPCQVELYSINGELLISENIEISTKINIHRYSSGMYILKVTAENNKTSFKKIVKR